MAVQQVALTLCAIVQQSTQKMCLSHNLLKISMKLVNMNELLTHLHLTFMEMAVINDLKQRLCFISHKKILTL